MSQTSTEPLFPPRGVSSSNLDDLDALHSPINIDPCHRLRSLTVLNTGGSRVRQILRHVRRCSFTSLVLHHRSHCREPTEKRDSWTFLVNCRLAHSCSSGVSRSVSIWAARFTGMVQPMLIPIAGLLDRFRISKSLNRFFMSLTIDCQRMTYQWPAGFELVGSKRVQLFFSNRFDTRYYFRLEDVSIIHQPSLENAAYRWSTRYSLTSTWFGQIVSSSMLWLWVRIAVECTCRSFPELERDSLWPCRSTSPSIVLVSFDEKMSAINLGS